MKPRTNFLLGSKILSKQLGLILAVLLEVTLVWAADKPWKTKPFQQWDQKELQTILTDSPWVRVTTIQRTWLPVSEKDVAPDPQINGGVRQMPAGGGEGVGGDPLGAVGRAVDRRQDGRHRQERRVPRAAANRRSARRAISPIASLKHCAKR